MAALGTFEAAVALLPSRLQFECGHSIPMTYGEYESLDDGMDLTLCPKCKKTHPFTLELIGIDGLQHCSANVLHIMFRKEYGIVLYYARYERKTRMWKIHNADDGSIFGYFWK
jgi:hypothetical protein